MKNSGKTLSVFLVVIVILLLCLSGIAFFYQYQESVLRKTAEASLEQLKNTAAKLEGDLKEAKKQVFVLEEKNKEADDKINDLTESLELEQGVKEELKKQNHDLTEALDNENQSKEKMRTELSQQLTSAQEKVFSLESQLTTAKNRVKEIESQSQDLQAKIKTMEADFQKKLEEQRPSTGATQTPPAPNDAAPNTSSSDEEKSVPPHIEEIPQPAEHSDSPSGISTKNPDSQVENKQIQLEPIVVAGQEGRVLSVDKENEFIIFNLGEKDGIAPGLLMSVYRGKDYLGDVKVSRVQSEMSAADFIPPFSSQKVRKNDQVVAKK